MAEQTRAGDQRESCVVMTTCASSEQAEALCAALLDRQLAACVQVLDITSAYVWQGQRTTEAEKLLLIKTRLDLYTQVEATLDEVHPYETPEVICLPILTGAASYLGWIDAVTQPTLGLGG